MSAVRVTFFREEDGECPLLVWIDNIRPQKAQMKVVARIKLLEELGKSIRRPHVDFIEDGIWELRERYVNTQYRMLFFWAEGKVVITNGFIKTAGLVPESEKRKARQYRELYLRNPEIHSIMRTQKNDEEDI
jgi:phage-related protein